MSVGACAGVSPTLIVTDPPCHRPTLSPTHPVTDPPCHPPTLSPTLPVTHPPTLSPALPVARPPCHPPTRPPCRPPSRSTYEAISEDARESWRLLRAGILVGIDRCAAAARRVCRLRRFADLLYWRHAARLPCRRRFADLLYWRHVARLLGRRHFCSLFRPPLSDLAGGQAPPRRPSRRPLLLGARHLRPRPAPPAVRGLAGGGPGLADGPGTVRWPRNGLE